LPRNRSAWLARRIASNDGQSTIADLANFATGGATLLIVEEDISA
jgi:hypothetical protein